MGVKRIKKAIKRISKNDNYLKYWKEKVDGRAFLLEAGQGKHANGNVFAFLRCLENSSEWADCRIHLAVTKDSRKEIEKLLRSNGFTRTQTIVRNSDAYKKALATDRYLITDNSFPTYFIKRPEQVYLNTWHGTPLKCLGRADIRNSSSIGNVQKNFLAADWLLFPNSYTKNVMMDDYMIERLFAGRSIVMDYPRNDVLYDEEAAQKLQSSLGLEGKRVVAYMPTWRGVGRQADVETQISEAQDVIGQIEAALAEDEVLYVNMHFLIGNSLDFGRYEKVRPFPQELETYDFLGLCDLLISDYSSVMMDFAGTGRDIIMYMYDYEEYLRDKGFYFDIKTLPFRKAYSSEELTKAMAEARIDAANGAPAYELDEQFAGGCKACATETMLSLMCGEEHSDLQITDYGMNASDTVIIYVADLNKDVNRFLMDRMLDSMSDEKKQHAVFAFEGEVKSPATDYLAQLDGDVHYMRMLDVGKKSGVERTQLYAGKRNGRTSAAAEGYLANEYLRLFGSLRFSEIQLLSTDYYERGQIIAKARGKKVFHKVPVHYYTRINSEIYFEHPEARDRLAGSFDEIREYDSDYGLEEWGERELRSFTARLDSMKGSASGDDFIIEGRITWFTDCLSMMPADSFIAGSTVSRDEFGYDIAWSNLSEKRAGSCKTASGSFRVCVPIAEMQGWYSSNILRTTWDVDGCSIKMPLRVPGKDGPFVNWVYEIKPGLACELRRNTYFCRLIVRESNVTDRPAERRKIMLAYLAGRLTPWNRPVLLYEKNCANYEESASVVFEKLVDEGGCKARFILDADYPGMSDIAEKYRRNIVPRFSFGHYYNLFASRSIISSETLKHALEKKSENWFYIKHVLEGSKDYVFLQHGVMYMVSLDSERRAFFRKGEGKGKRRVVVSSQLEAQHFTSNTDYRPEDIYVCGLPKFDRSVLNPDADRIAVMLTWRPWEFVKGIDSTEETGYYRMLKRIIESIPEELRDRLIVLPHPLLENQASADPSDPVWKYCMTDFRYDDVLKKTDTLITDYSSIAYDAFYRGSKVIFCWEEKEPCMKEYGESAHLMLTEDLAFGEVNWDTDMVGETVSGVYGQPQKEEHISNYRQIVEFHDGENTAHFLKMTKKDKIL